MKFTKKEIEKIRELDKAIKKAEDLLKSFTSQNGVTGYPGVYTGVDTRGYLRIRFDVKYNKFSILNTGYEMKLAQNIISPIIREELNKLKRERKRLTGNWFERKFVDGYFFNNKSLSSYK